MRLKAQIKNHSIYSQVIIHEISQQEGCLLFLIKDKGSEGDLWYFNMSDAKSHAFDMFQIEEADWIEIPELLPGTQQDYEAPTVAFQLENGTFEYIPYEEALKRGFVPPVEKILEISTDEQLVAEVKATIRKGQKINAIKLYRQHVKCDLATAKMGIDKLHDEIREEQD